MTTEEQLLEAKKEIEHLKQGYEAILEIQFRARTIHGGITSEGRKAIKMVIKTALRQ